MITAGFDLQSIIDIAFVGLVTFVCARTLLAGSDDGERQRRRWREELNALEASLKGLITEAGSASSNLDRSLLQRKRELEQLLVRMEERASALELEESLPAAAEMRPAARAAAPARPAAPKEQPPANDWWTLDDTANEQLPHGALTNSHLANSAFAGSQPVTAPRANEQFPNDTWNRPSVPKSLPQTPSRNAAQRPAAELAPDEAPTELQLPRPDAMMLQGYNRSKAQARPSAPAAPAAPKSQFNAAALAPRAPQAPVAPAPAASASAAPRTAVPVRMAVPGQGVDEDRQRIERLQAARRDHPEASLAELMEVVREEELERETFEQTSIMDIGTFKIARRLLKSGQELHVVARKVDLPVSEIRLLDKLIRQELKTLDAWRGDSQEAASEGAQQNGAPLNGSLEVERMQELPVRRLSRDEAEREFHRSPFGEALELQDLDGDIERELALL